MYGIPFKPGYLALNRSGELRIRGELLGEMLGKCRLCPRECRADRLAGDTGFCGATSDLRVASFQRHFGEESPLVGVGGSGTIFLSHCNLGCIFCQNWDISHQGAGTDVSIKDLAAIMLQLQDQGASNINIVTPTHYSPQVALALDLAAGEGLRLPLVWNTSGWERKEILELLDGIVDIYLADFKYMDGNKAARYTLDAPEGKGDPSTYPEITQQALIEMNRQVGVARPERNGLVYRGLMIRHLVMPGGAASSESAMQWIAAHLPKDTYVNIMIQYRPAYLARQFPEINGHVSGEEYSRVVEEARTLGLTNLDVE